MPGYISAIIDKSALQSLSAEEAKWLFHHFRVNIPPILFAEVLGDLSKSRHLATGSAVGDVRMLARKIESGSVYLNAAHYDLISNELNGNRIEMTGRAIVSNAKSARLPDGSVGLFVDQTPFQAVWDRWCAGEFDEMEREFSKVWRADNSLINLEALMRDTKHLRVAGMKTVEAVLGHVHASLFGPGRDYSDLDRIMQLAGAEPAGRAKALRRWNQSGRPSPTSYVPYTAFIARLEAIFMFGLHAGVITTRSTNRIDIEYFKYLPFTEIFSSSDQLHVTLFSAFSRKDQQFVVGNDLKSSLREMAEYYRQLPEDEKRQGSMCYADYPPVKMDNALTKIFDLRVPNWRNGANLPKPPRDTTGDAELMAELKRKFDWLSKNAK